MTDIQLEELSLFLLLGESPVEHFIGILPLKKDNAESMCSTLIDWLKKKDVQCPKLVGMGFDDAAAFCGKKILSSSTNKEERTTCYHHPLS